MWVKPGISLQARMDVERDNDRRGIEFGMRAFLGRRSQGTGEWESLPEWIKRAEGQADLIRVK